ncbi:sn-glycerol-3-phosphate ABC transporter ATP-binding protein UgpC [Metasolibacillus meyeri]|uniref:Sn-glycerol-3-phosphate ABC transporter ATP-binding protein UgpC n=1 Tax=Metasolibacillus meyeri TaxID=1071052 RepID=A0AAW9NR81_9BACL|nr:sn-glycerol-3-phosphate ABC transporter ATP-binding protein UgpC [Metasolibacillus meyeri]MEC1177864.1 sn-glycerol-3-phosphate ABC transporter ATP-binding protein UgpC [Metasolibacillus meyeri]
MEKVVLKNIFKTYEGDVTAVKDFNLAIQDREFIVLVGPSGCGKSTTLRMIAGLEEISSGDFLIDGKRMNDVPSKDRDIAMVFQNYALYPHMTVFDNMAFGLKLRKLPKQEIKERVHNAAAILDLEKYLDRKPKALSGGQRQRVALGRAIVRDAHIFLMDEPLSNLDAKLRVQMRAEITKLHQRLKTTTIYVTHDQTEAMTMASRLVVMKDGIVQQIGTPADVYGTPENKFVGGFIGSPSMNFFKGTLQEDGFKVGDTILTVPAEKYELLKEQGYVQKDIFLGVRPEHIYESSSVNAEPFFTEVAAAIDVSELTGAELMLHTQLHGQPYIARVNSDTKIAQGQVAKLFFDMSRVHFFDLETEKRIR